MKTAQKRFVYVAPSLLSADFAEMGNAVREMEAAGADLLHCDVMDGVFVPNLSFGPKMIADIRKHTKLPLDVHMMVNRPERYVQSFIDAGADFVTIHVEACDKIKETLKTILRTPHSTLHTPHSKHVRCGLVVNPATPANALFPYLELCDMVLLMSVNPGFGGQKFIEPVMRKITEVRDEIERRKLKTLLEIDGGITLENAPETIKAGANVVVAGSAIFSAPDKAAVIKKLRGAF